MSTNSFIARRTANGQFRAIYCHWDGYPEGVGATLVEHYTDPDKVGQLLDLGDCSSVQGRPRVRPGKKERPQTFNGGYDRGNVSQEEKGHSDVVVAYRDRGEVAPSRDLPNLESVIAECRNHGGEHCYVFDDVSGAWFHFPTPYRG